MSENEILEYRASQLEIKCHALRLGRERLAPVGAALQAALEREKSLTVGALALREGREPELDEENVCYRTAAMTAPAEPAVLTSTAASQMSGVFALFDSPTEILDPREGHFRETVKRGAFAGQMNRGEVPQLLYAHGRDVMIGKRPLGKITTWSETSTSATFDADLVQGSSYVPDVAGMARSGLLGCSFGFAVVRDHWRQPKSGLPERDLLRLDTFEISPCPNPAYKGTAISVRDSGLPPEATNITSGVVPSLYVALAAYLGVPAEQIIVHECADNVAVFSVTGTQGLQRVTFAYDSSLDVVPRPASAPNPVTVKSVQAFSVVASGRSAAADARKRAVRQMYVAKIQRRSK